MILKSHNSQSPYQSQLNSGWIPPPDHLGRKGILAIKNAADRDIL